jgi:hypothetical protein
VGRRRPRIWVGLRLVCRLGNLEITQRFDASDESDRREKAKGAPEGVTRRHGTHAPMVESQVNDGQSVPLSQCPVLSHVCWVIASKHCVAFGTHGVQALEMQAPGVQSTSPPHVLPVESQVCMVVVSLHRGALGVQTVQSLERQAPEEHAKSSPQVPSVSQVCCVAGSLHCVFPGTQTPLHMPVVIEQTNGQIEPLCQFPLLSQV